MRPKTSKRDVIKECIRALVVVGSGKVGVSFGCHKRIHPRPRLYMNGFKALLFKRSKTLSTEMYNEIYDYDERLNRFARRIRALRNGDIAVRFLDHLRSLGLSKARVNKYTGHIPALLKVIDFNLQEASMADVEKVIAWINQ